MPHYALKTTFYNPEENLFWHNAPENASKLSDLKAVSQSILRKNNIDWMGGSEQYGQLPDGTYTFTITYDYIDSVEQAEARFMDFSANNLWQDDMFAFHYAHGVKSRGEILDQDGNLVKLLHDNRGVGNYGVLSGATWQPYVPAENA